MRKERSCKTVGKEANSKEEGRNRWKKCDKIEYC